MMAEKKALWKMAVRWNDVGAVLTLGELEWVIAITSFSRRVKHTQATTLLDINKAWRHISEIIFIPVKMISL